MVPIWKDITVQLSASAPAAGVAYSVWLADTRIFAGTAHARPGQSRTYVRINDILAPYLTRGFAPAGEADIPFAVFHVDVNNVTVWQDNVYADWSYDPLFDSAADPLNAPLSDILLPGQLVPATRGDEEDSSQITFHIGIETPAGDFNADFNRDFLVFATEYVDVVKTVNPANTAWLDLMDYPSAVSVEVLGRTYRVGGGVCNKHALYYVNAYGAWDTLVIQGKTDLFDGLTRYTTERVYDNATPEARGEVNYATEIVRSYRFHTSPLPLAQSLGMHHLLNSPHVLVHDTVTGIVRPLVLTGNNTEHKQRGLNQYTIEARLARNRVRR